MRIQVVFTLVLGVACLSSCSMNSAGGGIHSYRAYDRPAKLPDNPAAVEVKVSLSKQRAYVLERGEMLLAMPVSIGLPDSPTPTGNFRILAKDKFHRTKHYGYAYSGRKVRRMSIENKPPGWSFKGTPMPYWCEFKPSYGFHTGWVKHSPATYDGCIRMHENLAPKFFRIVSVGTPVNISYKQPEDENWARMPLPPDAGPLPDYEGSMYVGDGYFSHHKVPKFQ